MRQEAKASKSEAAEERASERMEAKDSECGGKIERS